MAKPTAIERELARVAHKCWCERMVRAGWVGGPRFQPEKKIHDAIKPFARLSRIDQRQAILGVRVADATDMLAGSIDYLRSPATELGPRDVRIGSEVLLAQSPSRRGVVVGLDADPDWPGCLLSIRVRWPSGEVTAHLAPECELFVPSGVQPTDQDSKSRQTPLRARKPPSGI